MINENFINWFLSQFRTCFSVMDDIIIVTYQGASLSVLDILIGSLVLSVVLGLLIPTFGGGENGN